MSYELSQHVKEEIESWKARFPADRQRSAVISALHAVQHENHGFVTAEQMNAVAEYLELPTIQVYEVATFYSMFQTREVGRNEVAICTNVSCMLRGADDIVEHVEKKLGVKLQHNAFTDAANLANGLTFKGLNRRANGSQQEWACDVNAFKRSINDAWSQRSDIGHDIG